MINTVHKAMDTREFLSVLAEQYEQFNVVVLTIAPPQPVCFTEFFLGFCLWDIDNCIFEFYMAQI